MKIKALFKDLPVKIHGSKEVALTGLSSDSRRVFPGNLFIAKRGRTVDGAKFLPAAVQNGASALLTDILDPFLTQVTQIIHPDPGSLEAELAARFFHQPSHKLSVIGITGTNGKTTTTYLIRHILESRRISCGLMGTVECLIGKTRYDSSLTTPDAISVQKHLSEMDNAGCKAAVMEVSSHALDQGRVEKVRFSHALFSNLTPEHLDYHQTMERYKEAKQKLFRMLGKEAWAIVNADSPYAEDMLSVSKAQKMKFGIEAAADVKASNLKLNPQGMTFEVEYRGQKEIMRSHLIGRFNVYNILAALSFGLSLGYTLQEMRESIATFTTVPGRLERVKSSSKIVFVDYAHTPDALLNVLKTLRDISKGRILTVFGCGGNRDRLKRPMMAKVSEELSDIVIVTSDNPRNESPQAICDEILQGFQEKKYLVELDRREAIRRAIELAQKDDIVLIAGKGHEKSQIFAHKTSPFDDVEVARECLL